MTPLAMKQMKIKAHARILIVDDEQSIRTTLTNLLDKTYQHVRAVSCGEDALLVLKEQPYDLMLLDIHLPQKSGLDILEQANNTYPELAVIMLTGHASLDSAIFALQQGAINYLQKPASAKEILESVGNGLKHARLERQRSAMLVKAKRLFESGLEHLEEIVPEKMRSIPQAANDQETKEDPERFLKVGPLVIDLYRRNAQMRGQELDLTTGEYDLLLCLVEHAPKVVDPQTIVKETRGFECNLFEARDLVRWQVYLLRQKVEVDSSSPQFVLNVRGKGYMWAGA
jgi:DNA-binding response OmpR family regulator